MKMKSQKNQTAQVLKELLDYGWDIIISIYMLLILVVLPFYFEEGYAHIGTDKAMFFRGIILRFSWVVLPFLAVTLIRKVYQCLQKYRGWNKGMQWCKFKEYCRQEISLTDFFAAAYGLCVVLSYCFSHYKEEALWGTSGWYMGLIPQLTVVLAYFLISRCWKGHKWILLTVFPVSATVFLLGYLNRFAIYPIEMAYANPSFISTIGNINWYCGYMMCVLFGGVCLLWETDEAAVKVQNAGKTRNAESARNAGVRLTGKVLLILYIILGFGTLITQGSASGLLGLAAVLAASYLLSVRDGKRMQNWWLLVVLLCAAGSITYLLNKTGLVTLNNNSEGVQFLVGKVWILVLTLVSVAVWMLVKYSERKGKYPRKFFDVLGKAAVGASLILLGIYLVIAIINTVTEGRLLEMTPLSDNSFFLFNIRWGSSRGATFAAGAACFREQELLHKIFGVGPDCMAAYLYADGSESLIAMVKEAFANRRLTNAHNEWLTILVNTGILGAVSFAGMMVSAIWRYLGVTIGSNVNDKAEDVKKLEFTGGDKKKQPDITKSIGICCTIAMACGFCLLAYTVNNMVSFQQTMSLATISVVLGVGEHYCRKIK